MFHLAKADLSNMTVIATATRTAAECLGLGESLGQIRRGYLADLVIVDGNPKEDIALLQREECIQVVVQHGTVAIDRRLDIPASAAKSVVA
jgi:imidazolonepropionase-like amidohydrolase